MQIMSKLPKCAFGANFIKKRICLEKPGFSNKYIFFAYFRLPRYTLYIYHKGIPKSSKSLVTRTEPLDLVPLVTTALASALQVDEARLRNVAPRLGSCFSWIFLR